MAALQIERLEDASHLGKMRGAPVVRFKRLPVLLLPSAVLQFDVADPPANILTDRDAYPLKTLGRLDLVPVTPVILGELHLVIEDELVHGGNKVEVSLPGNVVRLHDGDLLHRHAGGSVASARSQSESKPRSICTSAR